MQRRKPTLLEFIDFLNENDALEMYVEGVRSTWILFSISHTDKDTLEILEESISTENPIMNLVYWHITPNADKFSELYMKYRESGFE